MRHVAFVVFWAGVFMALREWFYARKQRVPITRSEKLYPAIAFALLIVAGALLDLVGISPQAIGYVQVFSIAGILTVWAMRRRVRRTAARG
jgi:uncharacterized membrane protein SirB2